MSAAERVFNLLMRAYPHHARARFGPGIRYAWRTDLDAARANGAFAVAAFWIVTTIDALRFAAAERSAGVTMRGLLTAYVGTLLYGLDARDPWTFAGAALLLTLVAALAAWLPARRASDRSHASLAEFLNVYAPTALHKGTKLQRHQDDTCMSFATSCLRRQPWARSA